MLSKFLALPKAARITETTSKAVIKYIKALEIASAENDAMK